MLGLESMSRDELPTSGDEATRYHLLYDLGCAFSARLDLDQLFAIVTGKCREIMNAEGVAILLHDPERDELYFPWVAERDPEVAERLLGLRFAADQGFAGHVMRTGHAMRVDDVSRDSRFYGQIDRQSGVTTRNLIAAPLRSHQGPLGVLEVVNRADGAAFTDDQLAFLEALAGSVGVAIENARLYAQVKASEERLRAQVGALRREIAARDRFAEMVGTSAAMEDVFRLMDSAANAPITVLISGETGTGKELVARGIHRASERAEGPFIAVNCAALPETLLESELFGHRRGAFTGALADRRGLFEAATGGTIFLDEVGEMPAAMQSKLLRVLQEGEILPIGETRPRKVDVRVISATNRQLEAEVSARRFREDLYYRLTVFPIHIPALRERRDDIPLLADHFLAEAVRRHGKAIPGIEPAALERLRAFDWPGNVRELQNEIERAVALTRAGEPIDVARLSDKLRAGAAPAPGTSAAGAPPAEAPRSVAASTTEPAGAESRPRGLRDARAEFEARYITEVLRAHNGNVSHAAQALGLSRVMLQRKMKEYKLR